MLTSILAAYGFSETDCIINSFGTGLIHKTWHVIHDGKEYILQQVNHHVFKDPYIISDNIKHICKYLNQHYPNYLFVVPVLTKDKKDLIYTREGYFRLFPFIKNSVTFTTVEKPELAFEAAKQFGKFTNLLSSFDLSLLKDSIPNFHNLSLRYREYKQALLNGNKERISESSHLIKQLEKNDYIVAEYEGILQKPQFKKRVTHHDTKISNVLFNYQYKGLCVIDLDTVMPGYFISDVGDMMRTFLCPFSEEETDFGKIEIREDYFMAITDGYLGEMGDNLSQEEKEYFVYAGKFMIYMQAMRFLADYFNNDVYYGANYEGHNFFRTGNQLTLLARLQEKETLLLNKIKKPILNYLH